jgi:hypothetical protein
MLVAMRQFKPKQREGTYIKKKNNAAVVFDMKSRSEFLGGFSKRKAERRKKGNLINLKKELKRKREEQTMFRQHIQTEYQKAVDATIHNYGDAKQVSQSIVNQGPAIEEERLEFYPKYKDIKDPFGDVSVQISSLESPQFAILNRGVPVPETLAEEGEKTVPESGKSSAKKKLPLFARFRQVNKSSKLFTKRIEKRKVNRSQKGAQKKKKSKKSHS